MDEVSCVGDEERLDQCSFRGWFLHDCVHQEDAGVRCSSAEDGGIRLIGGINLLEGRVEVFFGGTWGTVCDAGWDINDATVVCRALGFMSADAAVANAYYGNGTGEILLSNVGCTGSEKELNECNFEYAIEHNCSHNNDVGVRCTATEVTTSSEHRVCNNYDVRMVNGPIQSDGQVEVCYKGLWGTVCASSWRREGAFVVCRQLGYDTVGTFYSRVSTEDSSPQIVQDLFCNGNETSLSECAITFGSQENCSFFAALNCSMKVSNPECTDGEVRLAGGLHDDNGTAQICERGHWVNLCASSWEDTESLVICRQLGYTEVDSFNVFDHQGNSKGNITSSISCSGKETVISQCSFSSNEINSCVQIVNVTCEIADSETPDDSKGKFYFLLLIYFSLSLQSRFNCKGFR
ncbi:Deleted in malignant brain tumors 1 protein [Holothuria leucospilota]|uniref:Deleted in malignant brain tumors 1 protein n=1 Tax=Holothuria leucospilota TaxID=206669 RepID=A0A9Q1H8L9_HOLLE|nr:Deleted in malignant brain tumors 1 protein [Holothuria leucospilota]